MSRFPRVVTLLLVAVLVRAAFHLVHWPVFEGPDEPFHLDRAVNYATETSSGFGTYLTRGVVQAIRAHPCGRDLNAGFGCPLFTGYGAFNIVRWRTPYDRSRTEALKNYEMHQPPLYYAVIGTVVRTFPGAVTRVEASLLLLRVISVLAFAAGVVLTLSLIGSEDHRVAVLAALLLPGGVEALVRASNDAFIFLWAALTMIAWRKSRWAALVALMAIGPLVKLSAFALCGAVIAFLYLSRRYAHSIGCALSSLLVFPVQWFRGWSWGGTYELNVTHPALQESAVTFVIGLGRSVYTFLKTIFWIGGWSFFRAPIVLVIAFFILMMLTLAAYSRRSASRATVASHLIGIAVAFTGFIVLAVLNRRLFGDWGGLGGWYFWGWFPWLSVAGNDLFEFRHGVKRGLLFCWLVFVLVTNVSWFEHASRLYGWTP